MTVVSAPTTTTATSPLLKTTERHLLAVWPGGMLAVPIERAPLLIGRSRRCDVTIDHPTISRTHARITVLPALAIEDLDSGNGTTLRGARIAPRRPVPFSAGEAIEIGSALLVVHAGGPLDAAFVPKERRISSPKAPVPRGAQPSEALVEDSSYVSTPDLVSVERIAGLIAPTDISVLLCAETGAGKEVFASLIHARSLRAGRPFVRVNCAAIPEALFESELFGHVRGAFTGAANAKVGLIEEANGGTLMLDEVGELPLGMQAKLLRVLESGELLRVGALRPTTIDVRVVAATNADLAAMMDAGRFRSDLYFRLNGMTIRIPPLRERPSDVAVLAAKFLQEAAQHLRRPPPTLSPRALDALVRHPWPGNVRELRKVIHRGVTLCSGPSLTEGDLMLDAPRLSSRVAPPDEAPSSERATPVPTLQEDIQMLERRRILDALGASAGNQSLAAKRLGISRRTLMNRMDEFGLPRPRKGTP